MKFLSTPVTQQFFGSTHIRRLSVVVNIILFEVGIVLLLLFSLDGMTASVSARQVMTDDRASTHPPAPNAPAAIRTVTNTNDSGAGSLRQVIVDAASGDTINFSLTYPAVITLTGGQLSIAKNLTINGPGANNLTLDGNIATRVFNLTATVTISGVTVARGYVSGAGSTYGGGIYVAGGAITLLNSVVISNSTNMGDTFDGAGGIYVASGAVLTVTNSAILSNTAPHGGGVYVAGGKVVLQGSTVAGNAATVDGGGIESSEGVLTVTNSTLSNNQITSIYGAGGGLYQLGNNPRSYFVHASIAHNTTPSPTQGSGIHNAGGYVYVANSVVAYNGARNFGGNASYSQGYNMSDLWSGSTVVATDLTGQPLLATLANNGGVGWTYALLPGSPAINAIPNGVSGCGGTYTIDQRGVSRPQGGACDIGAFESRGFTLTKRGGDNQSTLIETAFAAPLAITVTSSSGEPVNGGWVTFDAPSSGAGVNFVSTTITVTGNVASINVAANVYGGSYDVIASAKGALSMTFALTNTCASPITVVNTNDSGVGSLRRAIRDICLDGTINFSLTNPSTITLSSPLRVARRMTIDGPGATSLFVSGNAITRVFSISSAVAISGVTVMRGNASGDSGGGILVTDRGAVTVTNSVFVTNTANVGGGLYATGLGSLARVISSVFMSNTAASGGGVGAGSNANVYVIATALIGNDANTGGAVSISSGGVSLDASSIVSNSAASQGGGVYLSGGWVSIANSTIRSNSAITAGGGLAASTSSVSASSSDFSGNRANVGGGLYVLYANATVQNSRVSSNTASSCGGVYVYANTTTLQNSIISSNTSASYGGGLCAYTTAALTVLNSNVVSNAAASDGGGLYAWLSSSGSLTVRNSNVLSNTAGGYGGGAASSAGGTISVDRSSFIGNSAGLYGGGLANYASGSIQVTNTTLSGNRVVTISAGFGGGALYQSGAGPSRLNHSTIVDNAAAAPNEASSGVWATAGSVTLRNNIIANNAIANNLKREGGATFTSQGYNLSNNWNGVITDSTNLTTNPLLSALENHGGQLTGAGEPPWTYALLPGSPAIDAIPSGMSGCGSTFISDQRAISRPRNGACDIGAFESRGFTLAQLGNNQSAIVNTTFANPLAVTVTSAFTEPVNAGQINFAGPPAGAGITPTAITVTIADGAAWLIPAANDMVGAYSVAVSARGATPVTFTLTNTDALISGLTVANDGPTSLGSPTTLTATIASGTHVNYTWSFGDGTLDASGPAATVTHTYALTGTYNVAVAAVNSANAAAGATSVYVIPAMPYRVLLPIVLR